MVLIGYGSSSGGPKTIKTTGIDGKIHDVMNIMEY